MYSIVEFIEGNSVSFVPSKWIEGKKCYWPAGLATSKVNLYRQENVSPKKNWDLHGVKRIFCTASEYNFYFFCSYSYSLFTFSR